MVKFKFSLSSFRLCRPKNTSHFFSPINPKVLEIAYPTSTIPSPPPTTPSSHQQSRISKSKTAPLTTTPETQNSPVSFTKISGDRRSKHKKTNNMECSSDESGWFSNSDRETDSMSISVDSYKKDHDESVVYVKNTGGGTTEKKMKKVEEKRKSRMMKESLTVVKWSKEPYDDFKKSMLEMILEKKMFEAKDLEQLLQCFLSLNSKHHHADIISAFTEIWELLFL
ncbi:unnamed protein product [Lactuca saligna]|uniref:Transcription repressor n=1 Tax=Lactuca saligna TaxID=75948 RepID=A0AA35Z1U2_LACSI|nr:unnamed protein product [Lactuca saligna]